MRIAFVQAAPLPVVTENPIPAGLVGGMSYGSARCSTS
jgi:hypothetical protein